MKLFGAKCWHRGFSLMVYCIQRPGGREGGIANLGEQLPPLPPDRHTILHGLHGSGLDLATRLRCNIKVLT